MQVKLLLNGLIHSPDNLEAGDTVLVVLSVGLQVVDVDVRQPREQQLQLLLVEDRDQPEEKTQILRKIETLSISHRRGMMS